MINRDYEIFLASLCAYREARSESEDGIRAVLHVMRNRANGWHKSWTEIITSKNQLSSMSVPCDSQTVVWPIGTDPVFGKIQSIAAVIYNGGDNDDPTDGALYYCNPKSSTSPWFLEHIAKTKVMVATIGKHDFYSDMERVV